MSIAVTDIALSRAPRDELADVVALLGVPEHVLLEPGLGGQTLGYSLRLVYPSRGLQVSYFGFADQVDLGGRVGDAVCLGNSPYRKVTLDLTPSLSDLHYDEWDWATALGVEEPTLVGNILDVTQCLPFP